MFKLVMTLGLLSNIVIPVLVTMLIIADPCQAPFLGYILHKTDTGTCNMVSSVERLVILVFDMYMWNVALTTAVPTVFESFFLGLRCMDQYLSFLHR